MLRTGLAAGILSALGGISCLAIVALKPSVARADELADLRASQQLLERRLDQLAQVPSVGDVYSGGPTTASVGRHRLGGSFPRSFLIPGTDTSLRIGGRITENALYYFNGGRPNVVGPSTNTGGFGNSYFIPLHIHFGPPIAGVFPRSGNPARSNGNSYFFQSPQQSRINLETRTPTAWGDTRTFVSFDWANGNQFLPGNNPLLSTNDLVARFRFAYANLGGWLAGQAFSNFYDPDAWAESINFGGNVGEPGVGRIPQIRYAIPLAPWGIPGAVSLSAEAPETDGVTLAGYFASDAVAVAPAIFFNPFKSPMPDITAAWYIPQSWGHLDFGAVLRPTLQLKDGAFVDRTFAGYGVHFSGDFKPGWFEWKKDDITWQFTYGDGIGRYIAGAPALVSNYPLATPGTAAAAATVVARTIVAWGVNAGYQHWWRHDLRTNISGGIQHHDIANVGNSTGGFACSAFSAAAMAGTGNCGLNKELITAQLNVIWNPVSFVDIALEYMWGHRLVNSNLKGDENVLISAFRVSF